MSGLHETPGVDGSPVRQVGIAGGGLTARLSSLGARLVDLRMEGVVHPLVLGSDEAGALAGPMRYFGAIVGPVANRIAGGRFTLDGQVHALERNEGGVTTLHGGSIGLDQAIWEVAATAPDRVTFCLHQPHGTGGFPGTLDIRVTYSLGGAGVLTIEITGTADRPTHFNPAFHGFWNLSGGPDLSGHRLTVPAERYLPVDARQIPLGDPAPVAGTVFDHRRPRGLSGAIDHNYCLDGGQPACVLETDRLRLEIETDQPGMQVYDGGRMETAPFAGHGGVPYGRCAGIALEPQHWPDSPNRPDYPPTLLAPGETYRQVSRFRLTRLTD